MSSLGRSPLANQSHDDDDSLSSVLSTPPRYPLAQDSVMLSSETQSTITATALHFTHPQTALPLKHPQEISRTLSKSTSLFLQIREQQWHGYIH